MTKGKKLHREKWKQVALKDVALCCNESERDEEKRKQSKYISVEHITSEDFRIKSWSDVEMPTFFRKFSQGDVLVALRRVYLKKVAVAEFDGICSPHIYVFRSKPDKMLQKFLPFVFNESFFDFAIRHSAGSISPYVYWKTIKEFQFLLPPLSEQKLMADILYQIEDAIEKAEAQEQSLIRYRHGISDAIFHQNENWGDILPKAKKRKTTLGKVVANLNKTEKKPLEKGLTRFIGLEHIEPRNMRICAWGNVEKGTTFTKIFRKGQLLFGKRRAYLKKAAVADFDGICSGDILVLEAKPEKILPELLPYVLQNDAFFQYAVKTSAGSLSPRTKWKDIASFEFYLPEIEIQPHLMEVFNKFDNAIEQNRQHHAPLRSFKKGLLAEWLG